MLKRLFSYLFYLLDDICCLTEHFFRRRYAAIRLKLSTRQAYELWKTTTPRNMPGKYMAVLHEIYGDDLIHIYDMTANEAKAYHSKPIP